MSRHKIHPDSITSLNHDPTGGRFLSTVMDQPEGYDQSHVAKPKKMKCSYSSDSENFHESDLSIKNDTERKLCEDNCKLHNINKLED